jgi:hypothetical protein
MITEDTPATLNMKSLPPRRCIITTLGKAALIADAGIYLVQDETAVNVIVWQSRTNLLGETEFDVQLPDKKRIIVGPFAPVVVVL